MALDPPTNPPPNPPWVNGHTHRITQAAQLGRFSCGDQVLALSCACGGTFILYLGAAYGCGRETHVSATLGTRHADALHTGLFFLSDPSCVADSTPPQVNDLPLRN